MPIRQNFSSSPLRLCNTLFASLTALIAFLLIGCTGQVNSPAPMTSDLKVVGGNKATSAMPLSNSTVFIIGVGPDGKPVLTCTGSLISSDLVLTAGHCVKSTNPEVSTLNHLIYFGNFNSKAGPIDRSLLIPATDSRAEPRWKGPLAKTCDGTPMNDIALLKISTPLPAGYSPTPLAHDESLYADNLKMLTQGFGIPTEEDGYTNQALETSLIYDGPNVTGQIAVKSTTEHGLTPGDSGGPAALLDNGTYKIFGVVSNHCKPDIEYFESVPPHLDWLRASAKEMGADSNF